MFRQAFILNQYLFICEQYILNVQTHNTRNIFFAACKHCSTNIDFVFQYGIILLNIN